METLKIFRLADVAFAHWGEIWSGTVVNTNISFVFKFIFFSHMHLLLFIHEFDIDRQTETWEWKWNFGAMVLLFWIDLMQHLSWTFTLKSEPAELTVKTLAESDKRGKKKCKSQRLQESWVWEVEYFVPNKLNVCGSAVCSLKEKINNSLYVITSKAWWDIIRSKQKRTHDGPWLCSSGFLCLNRYKDPIVKMLFHKTSKPVPIHFKKWYYSNDPLHT